MARTQPQDTTYPKTMSGYFIQTIKDINASLERNTEAVPNNDQYHIIKEGKIVYSTRSLKRAQSKFQEVAMEMGYKPSPPKKLTPAEIKHTQTEQVLHKFFKDYDNYWDNAYKFRRGGRFSKR